MSNKTIKKVEVEKKPSESDGESKKVLHYHHSADDCSSGSFVHNIQLTSINYGVVLQTNDSKLNIEHLATLGLNLIHAMKDIENGKTDG